MMMIIWGLGGGIINLTRAPIVSVNRPKTTCLPLYIPKIGPKIAIISLKSPENSENRAKNSKNEVKNSKNNSKNSKNR